MTQLHPDTVAIRQLRVRRGADPGRALGGRETNRLRRDIEWADWPEAPGESWVFIRRLHARAALGKMARQLEQSAREQMHGSSSDNVVRFANLTELLTALLTDLVRGMAAGRWYWRRWSHLFTLSMPQAVASLLLEHVVHLPAVCARLCQARILEPVWLALDEAGAGQLSRTLAWRSGISLPAWEEVQGKQLSSRLPLTPASGLHISATVRTRWAPLLQRLPAQDARHQLALILIGQEVAPLMLQQAPAALLAGLSRDFGNSNPVPERAGPLRPSPSGKRPPDVVLRDAGPIPAPAGEATETAQLVQPGPEPAGEAAEAAPFFRIDPETENVLPEASTETKGTKAEGIIQVSSRSDMHFAASLDAEPVSTPAASRSGDAPQPDKQAQPAPVRPAQALLVHRETRDYAFDRFHTNQGGLLYLLNVLNRSEAQVLMRDHWEQLPSGWGWLYRLGEELELDAADPIVTFLAAQLGFEHPAELGLLPPLPARAELLELAWRWYGRAGLWEPSLLQLSAAIHASPSHVDLYAPLNAVQLPVRLAGLDINPGWLPWLGQVVIFHYD